MRYLAILTLLFFTCALSAASTQITESAEPLGRPKVGLVLSGGGARGAAHIGVIQILESLNVPIDAIVGTSFGAVIGGLYAAGVPIDEIDQRLSTLDWELILRGQVPRDHLYYRRKRDHDIFLIQNTLGFKEGQLYFPTGAVGGQRLYTVFKTMLLSRKPSSDFGQLPIPFKAVATDIVAGRPVLLESGDLALAMLASMSVPGLYAPVEVGDWMLVDGGVVQNLPIEVAKAQDLDVLIVVDVGTLMFEKENIKSVQQVLGQITNIYVRKNVDESLHLLGAQDILIRPHLEDIDTAAFDEFEKAVPRGHDATFEKIEFLKKLSNGAHAKHSVSGLEIDTVAIKNETILETTVYESYLENAKGPVKPEVLAYDIDRLYALNFFETIRYDITENDSNTAIVVEPTENRWGPNYIQGSLFLEADLEGESQFTLGIGVTRMPINRLAGEIRAYGLVGNKTGLLLEYYQPFSSDLSWYWLANTSYFRESSRFYRYDDAVSEYLVARLDGGLTLGKNLGEWGRASLGFKRTGGRYTRIVGLPEVITKHFADGQLQPKFEWDTFDDAYFPTKGFKGAFEYGAHRKRMGSDVGFDQISAVSAVAHSFLKHTLVGVARYQTTVSHQAPLHSQFALGGLFRLSGISINQLKGQEAALLSGIYYYEIAEAKLIPNYPFPVYVGASLETGNAWEDRKSVLAHAYRPSGSLFLGFNSALGPIYFGLGVTNPGRRAIHLSIGSRF
ncbi:MAG: patatin-like phospholipase family protein [Gammaproteobacteria bacterium]